VTGSRPAALVTSHTTRGFDGDCRAATADAVTRVARALGATGWRRWAPPERRAFERLSTVIGLIPDLARWPARECERVRQLMRAKGGVRDRKSTRLNSSHEWISYAVF